MPSALLEFVRQIPAGRVSTYGRLAAALGDVVAARWVGRFLLDLAPDHDCPSHRVVRSTGQLGGYAWGSTAEKARRLIDEKVALSADGKVDLARFLFDRFEGDRPLHRLRFLQRALPAQHSFADRVPEPRLVGGVDISYDPAAGEGIAAYTAVEPSTGRVIATTTVRCGVTFPYISTYLAFRELPLLLSLWEKVRREKERAEVLLVDGSGVLHPLRAGVATHFGILVDVPTIGVTKKLLCGTVDVAGMRPGEVRAVQFEGRKLGAAVRPHVKSERPLFVSSGHLTSTPSAVRIVVQSLRDRRLPEPIYWADRISRREVRLGRGSGGV